MKCASLGRSVPQAYQLGLKCGGRLVLVLYSS